MAPELNLLSASQSNEADAVHVPLRAMQSTTYARMSTRIAVKRR
jgi:hypothetical protein